MFWGRVVVLTIINVYNVLFVSCDDPQMSYYILYISGDSSSLGLVFADYAALGATYEKLSIGCIFFFISPDKRTVFVSSFILDLRFFASYST